MKDAKKGCVAALLSILIHPLLPHWNDNFDTLPTIRLDKLLILNIFILLRTSRRGTPRLYSWQNRILIHPLPKMARPTIPHFTTSMPSFQYVTVSIPSAPPSSANGAPMCYDNMPSGDMSSIKAYGKRSVYRRGLLEHLLAEIREISLSERRFYQKLTDIYATAIDYNKIVERANTSKEHMGPTTWESV